MTTININKLLLEQVQDLLYQATRWKGENHEVLTDLHDIKEAVKAVLAASATAPAWNNVPTCAGLWFCDEGDENPYRFTCHNVSIPLNPHLVGEGERWYGPIPPDGDKP